MAESMILKAESRISKGSAEARRLRAAGYIPGEVYGDKGNHSIQVEAHAFVLMLQRHGENLVLDLELDGKTEGKVLIKAVQHDPLDSKIIHADFIAISMDKAIEVKLPIVLVGEAAGVKTGGILEHQLSEIEISCLPGDLVEEIAVDISSLDVGDHVSVADVPLPKGLTAITDGEIVVASIVLPGVEKAETEAEQEEGEEQAGAEESSDDEAKEKANE